MSTADRDERRWKIAEIAADIIARDGLDATTVRRVAAEAGFSTTIVTHYFAEKQELLLWAFRLVAIRAYERFDSVVARHPTNIVEALLSVTATDEASARGWRVYLAFWEKALVEPVFAAEQRLWIETAMTRIAKVVQCGYGVRSDAKRIVQLLIAVAQGISIQALFDQDSWSQEEIRRVLEQQVENLLGARKPERM